MLKSIFSSYHVYLETGLSRHTELTDFTFWIMQYIRMTTASLLTFKANNLFNMSNYSKQLSTSGDYSLPENSASNAGGTDGTGVEQTELYNLQRYTPCFD